MFCFVFLRTFLDVSHVDVTPSKVHLVAQYIYTQSHTHTCGHVCVRRAVNTYRCTIRSHQVSSLDVSIK